MTTCFNSPAAKIWIDENIPCVFLNISGKMDSDEFNVLLEVERRAINQIIQKSDIAYSIIDLSQCSLVTQELITRNIIEVIKQRPLRGFTYLLFVTTGAMPNKASVPNMWIEIFSAFESALSKINFFRTNSHKRDWGKSRKPIQILLFLFYCGQKFLDFIRF